MSNQKQLLEQRELLLVEISEAPIWVSGSVIETTRKVGEKSKPFCYLSQSVKGKNKITYISKKQLDAFSAAAAEGERIRGLLAELSLINVKLIKAGFRND